MTKYKRTEIFQKFQESREFPKYLRKSYFLSIMIYFTRDTYFIFFKIYFKYIYTW